MNECHCGVADSSIPSSCSNRLFNPLDSGPFNSIHSIRATRFISTTIDTNTIESLQPSGNKSETILNPHNAPVNSNSKSSEIEENSSSNSNNLHVPSANSVPTPNVNANAVNTNNASSSSPTPYPRRPSSSSSSSSTRTNSSTKFALTSKFLDKWKTKKPPFGYNGLGELVYRRTYSRKKLVNGIESGENEQWWETVARVVNGTYNMQKQWIEQHDLGWNGHKAQRSAQEMFQRIFEMKFMPPGRGLWAMGSPITEQRGLFAALNNCAFVTTDGIEKEDDKSKPFTFLMDASMLGVGVGFDTKGAGKLPVKDVSHLTPRTFQIPDSREGWVEALRLLINGYTSGKDRLQFDYSLIRPYGTPIRGFGGVASGPSALAELLESVREILDARVGSTLTMTDITDIMNMIGRCVVAGNVRRTAEIAFGPPDSEEYLNLKNPVTNPRRLPWSWASNNSIFAELGMDYSKIAKHVQMNGEPGFAWLDNMQNYARMNGTVDARDHRVRGGNPCLEQSLESYELCCLVETFPTNHESKEDFFRTLKYAYLYAKTVTLGKTQWPETNRVMLRNRRIGCSVSGVAQFVSQRGLHELKDWLEGGYSVIQEKDKEYSDWFAIPRSIKTTSVKPSGTVSLLAGATPGMHYPESRFYIRRMRISASSELVQPLIDAGYPVEPARDSSDGKTLVVEFPIDVGEGVRVQNSVSMWEQLSLAAFLQRHWADNQVSCTVTFDPKIEGPHLAPALDYFQYQLKGISFLPKLEEGAYPQMPYQSITEEEYHRRFAALKPLEFADAQVASEESQPERFCDGDVCNVEGPIVEVSKDALNNNDADETPRNNNATSQ